MQQMQRMQRMQQMQQMQQMHDNASHKDLDRDWSYPRFTVMIHSISISPCLSPKLFLCAWVMRLRPSPHSLFSTWVAQSAATTFGSIPVGATSVWAFRFRHRV